MVAVCCLLSTGLVLDALVREVKSSPQWAAFEACLKEIERRCSAVVVVLVVSYGSCPLCFTSLSLSLIGVCLCVFFSRIESLECSLIGTNRVLGGLSPFRNNRQCMMQETLSTFFLLAVLRIGGDIASMCAIYCLIFFFFFLSLFLFITAECTTAITITSASTLPTMSAMVHCSAADPPRWLTGRHHHLFLPHP